MLVPVVAVRGVPVPAVDVVHVVAVADFEMSAVGSMLVRVVQVPDVRMRTRAIGAQPDEDDLVTAERKSGGGLDPGGGVFQHAAAHLFDPAAALAADVLVVAFARLVPRLTVAEVEAGDHPRLFERGRGSKDRRVVGARNRLADGIQQLRDRPGMPAP